MGISAITSLAVIGSVLWSPAVPHFIDIPSWKVEKGDHLIIDTENTMGYLVRRDGSSFTSFPVITGQKRIVHYIGRTYDATTPNQHWVAKSMHSKSDRTTFGPSGRFLRLYANGEEYTAYGIHEHRSEERMFGEELRFQSMGCIIVQSAVLDIIENTYRINGEELEVVTQAGMEIGNGK